MNFRSLFDGCYVARFPSNIPYEESKNNGHRVTAFTMKINMAIRKTKTINQIANRKNRK